MNKKVTIKDVAEAAGVCKATVSYVLNDRQDQKISEETKKKIWQVVNMLGYRPNAFAQNMRASTERQMIGVYLPRDLNRAEKVLCFDFLEDLRQALHDDNANIVLLGGTPKRINTADAIVAFYTTREDFFALGECNFIPLLSVDCRIDDALFFEIVPDCEALKAQGAEHFGRDFRYACIPPRDASLCEEIRSVFPDALFVRRESDLNAAAGKDILVTQKALADALQGKCREVFLPENYAARRAQAVADCIRLALSHEPCERHVFRV